MARGENPLRSFRGLWIIYGNCGVFSIAQPSTTVKRPFEKQCHPPFHKSNHPDSFKSPKNYAKILRRAQGESFTKNKISGKPYVCGKGHLARTPSMHDAIPTGISNRFYGDGQSTSRKRIITDDASNRKSRE